MSIILSLLGIFLDSFVDKLPLARCKFLHISGNEMHFWKIDDNTVY